MRNVAVLAVILILAATGYFVWSERSARIEAQGKLTEAESRLGLDAARVLSAHFEKQAALKVGTLRGEIIVRTEDSGFGGMVPSEQMTQMPTTVDYFVELSRMQAGSYRYSPQSKSLTIDIPDVSVASPNVDETKSRTEQKGIFISRRAAAALAKKASTYAAAKSMAEARRPENLDKARENARSAVRSIAEGPLRAAGLNDVEVAISYPWEPKVLSGRTSERWDVSRSIEEVQRERASTKTPP